MKLAMAHVDRMTGERYRVRGLYYYTTSPVPEVH